MTVGPLSHHQKSFGEKVFSEECHPWEGTERKARVVYFFSQVAYGNGLSIGGSTFFA